MALGLLPRHGPFFRLAIAESPFLAGWWPCLQSFSAQVSECEGGGRCGGGILVALGLGDDVLLSRLLCAFNKIPDKVEFICFACLAKQDILLGVQSKMSGACCCASPFLLLT